MSAGWKILRMTEKALIALASASEVADKPKAPNVVRQGGEDGGMAAARLG